jgi:hypothetical protein
MQGYMAGRLSTGTDGGAALAPYMMPGSSFMPGYGGFGQGFGLLIGLGLLMLGFFFLLTRGRAHHRRWHEGKEEWAAHMHQEMRRWHEQRGGPWDSRPEDESTSEQRTV